MSKLKPPVAASAVVSLMTQTRSQFVTINFESKILCWAIKLPWSSGFVYAFHPEAPASNPVYSNYAFSEIEYF